MDTALKSFLEKGRELKFDFEFGRDDKKKCEKLFDELCSFKYKKENRIKEFEKLIVNLIATEKSPVLINLNRNWYTGKPWTYETIKTSIEALKTVGLIDRSRFYNNKTDPSKSRITRAWATPKLKARFQNPFIKTAEDVGLVELRDVNKNPISYPQGRGVAVKFKQHLMAINRINSKAAIYLSNKLLNTTVRAIFTINFSYHGRLYSNGPNGFQLLSKVDRLKVTIDGDPVSELDYSGLHPRLLYAAENRTLDFDPYSIVDDRPEVRRFLKTMLLAMINSPDRKTAIRACTFWRNTQPDQKILLDSLGINTHELMDKFLQTHEPIKKYLCSGSKTGMRLMNKDANIALDICSSFAKRNRVILPIHDSFVVKAEHCEELRESMNIAYANHNKGLLCPIN